MNLKPKNKEPWFDDKHKKFIAVYIALALVLVINQVVFSYLLKGRENAKAFSVALGTLLAHDLGDSTVAPGDTDVLVADFFAVDPWLNQNVTCSWSLGNPCTPMVDADGTATDGAGTDDDDISYFFQLESSGDLAHTLFATADNVCADDLSNPTCVYVDDDGNCDVSDGTITYILGSGCGGVDNSVAVTIPNFPMWVHSESVNANGSYDYGNGSADTETIWILNQEQDTVLRSGFKWGLDSRAKGIYQGDVAGTWHDLGTPGGEGYIDVSGHGYYNDFGDQEVIVDDDGDGYYEVLPDDLMDADGSATVGTGTDDDALNPGTPLTPLAVNDNVCINTIGSATFITQVIIYVDGNANCTPGDGGSDTIIRDDVGAGLLNTGAFPYTYFNATRFLVYADLDSDGQWTWGNGAGVTESLWVENDYYGGWFSTQHNILIEADGTGSLGHGADDDGLVKHSGITPLAASDNVCLAFTPTGDIEHIEDIYIDGNNNCIPADGGVDTILQDNSADGLNAASILDGTWANMAGTLMYHVGPAAYAWGNSSATTESLWTAFWLDGTVHPATYTAAADTDVYSRGGIGWAEEPLVSLKTGVGPTGQPLIYADADYDGVLSSDDAILEDIGNVQTGPAGRPNGVIDRWGDAFNRATFEETGTALPSDVSSLKLYLDAWWAGMNGYCDVPGAPGSDDLYAGDLTYDPASDQWRTPSDLAVVPYWFFFRICVRADISPRARIGATIRSSIPELYDANANGIYDAGDKGAFYWSTNDGPTGGSIIVPYAITTIFPTGAPTYSAGPQDLTLPGPVSEVNIKADSTGKVTITWKDPADADLSGIAIDEVIGGKTNTNKANKGIQLLVLENRQVGSTYTYKFRTEDTNGNLSQALVFLIMIPAQGETEVSQPSEILPNPFLLGAGEALPPNINVSDLVKSSSSAAVYYIGQDNKKHDFPNELIYKTWYDSFSPVKIISAADLDKIVAGKEVYIREGTYLVKRANESKVYAIEPGGTLRWIETEIIAMSLYGSKWTDRVVDISSDMFNQYTVGSPVASNVHPTASLISYSGGIKIYYIENGQKREVSTGIFTQSRFQTRFVAKGIASTLIYPDGLVMTAEPGVSFFDIFVIMD